MTNGVRLTPASIGRDARHGMTPIMSRRWKLAARLSGETRRQFVGTGDSLNHYVRGQKSVSDPAVRVERLHLIIVTLLASFVVGYVDAAMLRLAFLATISRQLEAP